MLHKITTDIMVYLTATFHTYFAESVYWEKSNLNHPKPWDRKDAHRKSIEIHLIHASSTPVNNSRVEKSLGNLNRNDLSIFVFSTKDFGHFMPSKKLSIFTPRRFFDLTEFQNWQPWQCPTTFVYVIISKRFVHLYDFHEVVGFTHSPKGFFLSIQPGNTDRNLHLFEELDWSWSFPPPYEWTNRLIHVQIHSLIDCWAD